MANPKPTGGFKKGDPNINRKGRPKGKTITEYLKELGESNILEYSITTASPDGTKKNIKATVTANNDFSINATIAVKLLQKAIGGDLKAMQIVLDRTEGASNGSIETANPPQKIEISILNPNKEADNANPI